MNNIYAVFLAVLTSTAFLQLTTSCSHPEDSHPTEHTRTEQEKTLYTCPMHPHIIRDAPGDCPICGMDLVEKKTGNETTNGQNKNNTGISIDPVMSQNMGIRTVRAQPRELYRSIHSYGRAVIPDNATTVVNLRFSGWITDISTDEKGLRVKQGEHLFSVYSPDVYAAQKEFLLALDHHGETHTRTAASERQLRLLGLGKWLTETIRTERKAFKNIPIFSPRSGYIENRPPPNGSRIKRGRDVIRIINDNQIWIHAQLYKRDISRVQTGNTAHIEFTVPGIEARKGTVSFISPELSEKTDSVTARIVLENKKHDIRPGMPATVSIAGAPAEKQLSIPGEAVIRTGTGSFVFISRGDGTFHRKKVETGMTGDSNQVQIISGLQQGDIVVVSGQFLLDSESRLREAVRKFSRRDLHSHDDNRKNKTMYSCPVHSDVTASEPGVCPRDGLELVPKSSGDTR